MIVLDAAAVVDVLLDRSTAAWVLQQLANERISAPAHQPAEVLSAVSRLTRSGVIDSETAVAALHEYGRLEQKFVPSDPDHLLRSLQLQPRVRVVDGLYVVLAEDLVCPLVTTDRRLAGAGLDIDICVPPTA